MRLGHHCSVSEDFHPPAEGAQHTLPAGSVVGGMEITGVIGEGGFGIVYLALDATLQRQVALKEYMPSSLASRSMRGPEVSVKSPRFQETFDAGLRSFVNEARLLAHFDHPALVKVHQFWQGNRTAYMVMPFYEGPTLKEHVRAMTVRSQPPNEATLRAWIDPLLDALALMHSERCFHRDIAPDNILLTPRGPLLLDLGAARKVIADMTQALTVILKPGYAPIEQYGEATTMVQGPWTDLYALASVVYFCITGRSPITSVERLMGDPLPLLGTVAAGSYSDAFLQAIDAALAVRPIDRPQSVAELRGLLDGTLPPRRQAPRGLLQTGCERRTACGAQTRGNGRPFAAGATPARSAAADAVRPLATARYVARRDTCDVTARDSVRVGVSRGDHDPHRCGGVAASGEQDTCGDRPLGGGRRGRGRAGGGLLGRVAQTGCLGSPGGLAAGGAFTGAYRRAHRAGADDPEPSARLSFGGSAHVSTLGPNQGRAARSAHCQSEGHAQARPGVDAVFRPCHSASGAIACRTRARPRRS